MKIPYVLLHIQKPKEACSDLKEIKPEVPQGSVLGPVLYLLYTYDIPQLENNTIATFANGNAAKAVGHIIYNQLMNYRQLFTKSKVGKNMENYTKSVRVDFTNNRIEQIPIHMNGQRISRKDCGQQFATYWNSLRKLGDLEIE